MVSGRDGIEDEVTVMMMVTTTMMKYFYNNTGKNEDEIRETKRKSRMRQRKKHFG